MPADHDIFSQLNEAQWLWYFYNFLEDQEEAFNSRRDMVEYHASFIEPESVRKIRESREKAVEVPEDEFMAGMELMFGRALSGPRKKGGKIESVDPTAAISNYNITSKMHGDMDIKQRKGRNYKHWLNSNLE